MQVELVSGASDGDVEQASFLVDPRRFAEREVGREMPPSTSPMT